MSDSMFRRVPVPVRLGAALGVALLAAACGSSASSSSSTPTSAATTGTPAAVSSATSSATVMVISTKSSSAGKFLTNGSGRAVYLWVKDGHDQSMCTGACASTWPPVTTTGTVIGSGGVLSSDLGTITRAGGVKQVTYDGHPLYYYVGDTGSGTVNGQGSTGYGAYWWLVTPTGTAITASVTLSGTTTGTTSTGSGSSGGGGSGW